ncbi:MAG: LTA synthase family protein [Oscillospiraceae bacterium]|nr:LTA synthase family protein [Oscillospiraceae bacterium]
MAQKIAREPRLWLTRLIFWLTPFVALFMVEIMNEKNPFTNLSFSELVMNLIWYIIALLALWLVFGRRRRSVSVYLLLMMAVGAVNHFVLLYRGRILFPQDVATWQTALNVAGEYDLSPDVYVLGSLAILVLWLTLVRLVMPSQKHREYFRNNWLNLLLPVLCVGYTLMFFLSPWLPAAGIKAQQWKTQSNGFVLNFTLALRYSKVQKPDGYSLETLEDLTGNLLEADEAPSMTLYSAPYVSTPYEAETKDFNDLTPHAQTTILSHPEGIQPVNLICIMDESFADLAIFDKLELNQDSIPFYHSLKENTIKGWMYSPVTGAGTANVEYEFLTGNSTAFLPDETTAYQLYVREQMPSLISWAKSLGYETTTVHPYRSSGWNRVAVYEDFGVDHQVYNTDFVKREYVRGVISDDTDFRYLEGITSQTEGDRQFIFNVTIQNHGGYRQSWFNLNHEIKLSGSLEGCSEYTEQYLNLMKNTDEALEYLLSYYSEAAEPTMIVFFGDHQGKLSSWFYEHKLYQKDLDHRTLEELEKMYVTPFFIWTNYDSHEAQDVMISSNYLGVLTALCSNQPLTGYQAFLTELYEELPVFHTIGCIDREGQLTNDLTQLTQERQTLLEQYRLLSYYNLFGIQKHRNAGLDNGFFALNQKKGSVFYG